jgi:hypothetical protein
MERQAQVRAQEQRVAAARVALLRHEQAEAALRALPAARLRAGLAREALAAATAEGPEHAHDERRALARAEEHLASLLRRLEDLGVAP